VEELLRAATELGVDLIIPVTDAVIVPLARARDRFEPVTKLAVADPAALASVQDKLVTLDLATQLAIPTPRSELVTTVDEARSRARDLRWPIVLKPQASLAQKNGRSVGLRVSYANDLASLEARMAEYEGRSGVLLQEYSDGIGYGVEILAHEGRPLAAFQHRRLREVPFTGGASSFRESVPLDPTLYDYSERILAAVGWTGLAMVEFKVGRAGATLMEVNGRVWGSLPLAVRSGMDFPARLADLHLHGPPAVDAPDTSYEIGVRSRDLELEVVWIASVLRLHRRYEFLRAPSRLRAVSAAVRLLDPRDGYDAFARDDPGPGWSAVADTVRLVRSKLGQTGDA
jgi:predicted ATP-grasp superfamily ATP-dependent carboligase